MKPLTQALVQTLSNKVWADAKRGDIWFKHLHVLQLKYIFFLTHRDLAHRQVHVKQEKCSCVCNYFCVGKYTFVSLVSQFYFKATAHAQ